MARKHERRLKRFLQARKLLFVSVGATHAEDRIIDTATIANGATVANREYNDLLRDIVACIVGP